MSALRPSPDVEPIMADDRTHGASADEQRTSSDIEGERRMRLVLRQIRVLLVAAAGLSGSLAMAADPEPWLPTSPSAGAPSVMW
jgi:hypothetical protein